MSLLKKGDSKDEIIKKIENICMGTCWEKILKMWLFL